MRSSGILDPWGRRVTVAEEFRHQYVTAVIRVRTRELDVVTLDGELAYEGPYPLQRVLR